MAGRIWYFQTPQTGKRAALYAQASTTDKPAILLDPDLMFPEGSSSIIKAAPSPTGLALAYVRSDRGSDWQTIRLRDLTTGTDLSDSISSVRFAAISWTNDGRGFFYSRSRPPAQRENDRTTEAHALYYHRLGSSQVEDKLVFEPPSAPDWYTAGTVSDDGRYLWIATARGSNTHNRLHFIDLGNPDNPDVTGSISPLQESDDATLIPIGNTGTTIYALTDFEAPRRRIVAFDLRTPFRTAWRTVVPQATGAIQGQVVAGDAIAVQYLVDAQSQVQVYGLDGRPRGALTLPGTGIVEGLSGRQDTPELFFSFTSPLLPSTAHLYDLDKGRSTPLPPGDHVFDPSNYETRQLFATSKDGTRVPYFVTARRDVPLDGTNPTMLSAYGGFGISVLPTYRRDAPAWLEHGGIWVTASVRGGGEYGESWHRAGMRERKQNVFDDCVAVAEDLIRRGFTSSRRLAIEGASNGGLLVAAVVNQRPDLFAAALPSAAVLDMLRYDQLGNGAAWVPEYGSATQPEMFPHLLRYSPLHNLKADTCYPSILVTAAQNDERVSPNHSFKYAAAAQKAQGCKRPVLLRVGSQRSADLGGAEGRIAELADEWAFVAAQMDPALH